VLYSSQPPSSVLEYVPRALAFLFFAPNTETSTDEPLCRCDQN